MDTSDFWDRSAETIFAIAFFAGVAFFIGLIGWQSLRWLQTSQWPPVPLSVVFDYFNVDLDHIYSPREWLGLARVMQWLLNLPLSVIGPAALLLVAHGWRSFVSSGVAPVRDELIR